ncbi:MAG TPA: hypothetical protein VNM70_14145, partial [Burkholderiales bacterium]|nr:hypothetical protein [Burkholderiales bacterium]
MSGYPKIIHTEEGMRDGLQIESPDIPLEAKVRLLNALSETGLKEIAVGSFVSPKWTPQMACMDDLVRAFTPKPGVRYTYTALNDKGQDRAAEFTPPLSPKAHEYSTRVDMCDVFAQRNTNRTQAQQIEAWPKMIEKAKAKGAKDGGLNVSNCFGSNWTGEVPTEKLMSMFDRMIQAWNDAGLP